MRKEEVIDLHFGFFRDFGFDFHPENFLFQKSFPEGNQVVFIHYSEYPEVSYLEYNLGVRIHQVEQIIHKFLPTLSDYSTRSLTLIQTLDAINPDYPRRYAVKNNQELNESILAAERFFAQEGFKWLDQLVQPKVLQKAFAQRKDKSFQSQNFVYAAFRSVTLAKLYKPEDYPILREFYLDQIKQKEMTPFTIASFLRLLDFLDHF
ncbi:MAG: hypothetical protein O9252_00055 [Algoriphagus sp.]|nr:hypothetical protein [Algoriphagus sp.]